MKILAFNVLVLCWVS